MADIQYSGEYAPESGYDYSHDYAQDQAQAAADVSRVTQLINWAGAVVSIGLVVGMAIWAWQLLMRDVTDVPVIRAMEGPMRVAPENPGGAVAENQGLAVNRLAEGAEAAPVPDQLVLAPAPMDFDDVPELEQAFESASAAAVAPVEEPVDAPAVVAEVSPEAEAPVTAEDTEALIERLLAEAQPLEGEEESALPNAAEEPELVARADTIPISVPGVRRSPRPATRPADIQARAEAAAAAAVVAAAAAAAAPEAEAAPAADEPIGADEFEIAASELETGTRLVQLGAFDTPDLARAEWQRLSQTYPDFFLGRARVIEQASSGGQSFYRLRAHGFGDLSASRRFCAALVAQGAACIPVTVR
ncbi:SPOR domain-containing protein [Gymnodinialimonas hymeniacidonis]|uniref:SPOR domain-containing protein n=1 Tax=Gymnodinialimonas hymeniacidonis TaxID=3126508 RepID=UPI0034C6C8ED